MQLEFDHMKTKTSTPASAITFRQNVMYFDESLGRSIIVEAGSASPWTDVADVPERLRDLIGVPNFDTPPNTSNQYWVPKETLRTEAAALQALNTNDEMSDSLREELESRGREYQRLSAQRNAAETEIEAREEMDRKRLVAELEKEARQKLGRKL